MRALRNVAIAAAFLAITAAPARAGEESWGKDLDAALKQAAKEKRPLVVDLSQPG